MVRPTVDWYREDPQIAALKQLLSELPPEFRELAQRIKNAIDQIHPDIIGVILPAIHETLMKALEGKSQFSRKVSTIL